MAKHGRNMSSSSNQ